MRSFDLGVCSDYGIVVCNSAKMIQILCYSETVVSAVKTCAASQLQYHYLNRSVCTVCAMVSLFSTFLHYAYHLTELHTAPIPVHET
jgi:hypothetical protein